MNLIARLKALVNRLLPRASFARSVGVLAGGTAVAQGIGVLALPFITRLYTPEDFSVLAVFSSIVAIVSVSACLRLEIAIPLPEKDEDAANLLALALIFCICFSAIAALLVWFFVESIVVATRQPGLAPYLWMVPLGIGLAGSYSAIQFWSTRKKRFPAIAKTRLSQTIGSVLVQIGFGIAGVNGPFGLLLGQLMSSSAGLLGLGRFAWRNDHAIRSSINQAGMGRVLKAYEKFPKYSTFEAFANIAAIQLPIIIIGAVAVGPEAGYLFLAMKATAIPMALIGGAVSQVYLSHAAKENREGHLADFTLNIIDKLIKTGVGPLIFVGILSPAVFPLLFGTEWSRAGDITFLMTPWVIMQFMASPISFGLHVTGRQKAALLLQIAGLIVRTGAILVATYLSKDNLVEVHSVSGFVFYVIYFSIVMTSVEINKINLIKIFLKDSWIVAVWVVLALMAKSFLYSSHFGVQLN